MGHTYTFYITIDQELLTVHFHSLIPQLVRQYITYNYINIKEYQITKAILSITEYILLHITIEILSGQILPEITPKNNYIIPEDSITLGHLGIGVHSSRQDILSEISKRKIHH
jgi:hypothetical protein